MNILENILLASLTSFRIGGPARYFAEAKSAEEIKEAINFAKGKNIPFYILGGGTKILVADEGFIGLVIKPMFKNLEVDGERINAGAGVVMGQIVVAAEKNKLIGMEWAAGLPGTVGGAIHGNSGCFGGEMQGNLESAEILDPKSGEIKKVSGTEMEFGYRTSRLKQTGEIVLKAIMKLTQASNEAEAEKSKSRIREVALGRAKEQPLGEKTAGSAFVGVLVTAEIGRTLENSGLDWQKGLNRAGYLAAGWLLEQAGLKGFAHNNAAFSEKHANFILNKGGATASDVVFLIDIAKQIVKEKFGIDIYEEIQYIRFEGRR